MGKFLDTILGWFGIDNNNKLAVNGGKKFETITPNEYVEEVKNGWNNVTNDIYNGMIDITEDTTKELEEIAKDLTGGNSTGGNSTGNQIQDTTNESAGENSVIPIGGSFDLNALKDLQKEQWAREDNIRKEVQAREDSAYQRTVEDMKKAGINPNLMNVQPAASGGGITSATGIDYNGAQIEVEKYLTEIEKMLDRELKADENQKDRLSNLLRGFMTVAAILIR